MAQAVADCPRCGSAKTTFNVLAVNSVTTSTGRQAVEAFSVCRHCSRGSVLLAVPLNSNSLAAINSAEFVGRAHSLNKFANIEGYVSLKDKDAIPPPEHLPPEIENVFREGAQCLAVGCYNAAGTMFRLCVDLATKARLPAGEVEGLNSKTRRDLGLRLPWLFANGHLPRELSELSTCIKEDGNDGAHAGTLQLADAQDLLDFTEALLERLYTEPERLKLAQERRATRRAPPPGN